MFSKLAKNLVTSRVTLFGGLTAVSYANAKFICAEKKSLEDKNPGFKADLDTRPNGRGGFIQEFVLIPESDEGAIKMIK